MGLAVVAVAAPVALDTTSALVLGVVAVVPVALDTTSALVVGVAALRTRSQT